MARLNRHEREWIRAEKQDEQRAYMSDGIVLVKTRDRDGKWGPWRVWGEWPALRYGSLHETRNELLNDGWTLQMVPLDKAARS